MGPGLPEKVAKEDLDLNNFFGFVEVKVKSKVDMLHKKPLHALYEGGKLMFRHFSEPTTIILFSEELKCGVKSGMYEYEIVRGEKLNTGFLNENHGSRGPWGASRKK